MTKLNGRDIGCVLALFWAATVLVAPAQIFTNLASFDGGRGAKPFSSLTQGTDGNFYGTASGGGNQGAGTVFRIAPGGTLATLYSFCGKPNCTDGATPLGGLVLADGNLYGTTSAGGVRENYCEPDLAGCGTVFKITSGGALTTLYGFIGYDGATPIGGLIQGTDGSFYGTTFYGGVHGPGNVFKITPAGVVTSLYSFCAQRNCPDGSGPSGGLVQGPDHDFYGTTMSGGIGNCSGGCGTIFKITSGGKLTTLHSFSVTDGAVPFGLVRAADGNLYGTTGGGGANNFGTFFMITPRGTLTTLHSFSDGSPSAGLVQASDGNFYGTTGDGGNLDCDAPAGCGTIFKITSSGTVMTLHSFDFTDGEWPYGGLLQATDGSFYGTTLDGGDHNLGTVFSLDIGLDPFVKFVHAAGRVGQTGGILGQGFIGTTSVSLDGIPASFRVVSDTFLKATVPAGGTTGYVTVITPSGTLTSNVPFYVIR